MTTKATKEQIPLPKPSGITKPFWEACKRGELTVQKCLACGGLTFIPEPACMHCLSPNLTWIKSSGKGTVYSYTTIWRPQTPAFSPPYVVAIIDLDEGYQMMSNIVDIDHTKVKVGMKVEVKFTPMSEEITLPYFRPASGK